MEGMIYLVLIAAPLLIGCAVAISLVRGLWRRRQMRRRRAASAVAEDLRDPARRRTKSSKRP